MLYDSATIRSVANILRAHFYGATDSRVPPLVCDPVCVSTSGHALLEPDALKTLITEIFPLAAVITPNKSETETILSQMNSSIVIDTVHGMVEAARELTNLGCKAALVKGGHFTSTVGDVTAYCSQSPGVHLVQDQIFAIDAMEILHLHSGSRQSHSEVVLDVLHDSVINKTTLFIRPRIDSPNTHGTGCTLSSSIASHLATGSDRKF